MKKTILFNKNNSFYPVNSETVKEVENKLGIKLPIELVTFYSEVGYGFIESKKGNINRLMDPESIYEFYDKSGQFDERIDLEDFDDLTNKSIVFFEVSDSLFLSIGVSDENNGVIFYLGKKIANNLEEFIRKQTNDEDYFI